MKPIDTNVEEQNQKFATIDIRTVTLKLKKKHKVDGIFERIDDIAFDHGIENCISKTETFEVKDENFDAFRLALERFFRDADITPEVFSSSTALRSKHEAPEFKQKVDDKLR